MNFESALQKLVIMDQVHLLDDFDKLASDEKDHLLKEIAALNIDLFFKQQEIQNSAKNDSSAITEPFLDFHGAGNAADEKLGKEAISQGKMGCIIVAGGQGTRLKLNGPKGMYPISLIKKKSLFEILAEKTKAASKQSLNPLKIAIMTSPLNHEMVQTYFASHDLFGLSKEQLDIFPQGLLPLLNEDKKLFLENNDTIAKGPDGNGHALYNFYKSGIADKWKKAGIEYVNFILIDNPLADPFDAELLGFHIRNQMEVTIKCTAREDENEKVGLVVKQQGKVKVVEYSEIEEKERLAKAENGSLKHFCANISLFCFNLSFIEKNLKNFEELPLHVAKKAHQIDNQEHVISKYEYFIFDLLPLADKVQALFYPREVCFAPLKNLTGKDSPQTVQEALLKRDKQVYEKIFGEKPLLDKFELSQDFYYPTEMFIEKWKLKSFSNDGYLGE